MGTEVERQAWRRWMVASAGANGYRGDNARRSRSGGIDQRESRGSTRQGRLQRPAVEARGRGMTTAQALGSDRESGAVVAMGRPSEAVREWEGRRG